MVASKTKGEFTLTSPRMTVFSSTNCLPKSTSAMAMESCERDQWVTEPMNDLSPRRAWAWIMSRWRLLTGTSVGSQTVPPEYWSMGLIWMRRTKFSKSSSLA